jgi:voltage-gated potassium channel
MKLARWEKNTEVPLLVLAVLFLVSYSWQVLDYENTNTIDVLDAVTVVIWVLFGVDYAVRLLLARHRTKWFFKNFFDFLVIVLPALRPLKLLRLVTVLNILHRTIGSAVRSRILTFALGSTALLVYIASLAVLDVEREEGEITTFSEALWWSVVTITTVGYGDYFPVTGTGRLIAVGLMVGGVVLVGVIVGTLSSWIVERVSADIEEVQDEQQRQLELLREEIHELRASLDGRRSDARESPGA